MLRRNIRKREEAIEAASMSEKEKAKAEKAQSKKGYVKKDQRTYDSGRIILQSLNLLEIIIHEHVLKLYK